MTEGQITTALEVHGVEWRKSSAGDILAFEAATMRLDSGIVVDASEWIPAPTTRQAMLDWLGY